MNSDILESLGLDFLEHYGVKGMKWGVRNDKPSRSSHDFNSTKKLRNRPTHELTNKQLRTINDRLNLEQNYRRLNPSTVSKGHAAVKGILGGLTTAASLYSFIQSPAGKAAIAAGKTFIAGTKVLKTIH